MANLLTGAPRGTQDVLPKDSGKWQYVERTALDLAKKYGFSEIRFPTFEHTELFTRSVGDTTDVVQKEMYTFEDKGNRSVTLRPEGTAGAMRAILQNCLLSDALPLKVSYVTSCFRYEKPGTGRLREFHQFGAELAGAQDASADAQLIAMVWELYQKLGLKDVSLEINSIGCPRCRPRYLQALKDFFAKQKDQLCPTCLERLDRNPMRILDCKSPVCSEIAKEAPVVLDYLCDECHDHFQKLQSQLQALDIPSSINSGIVRGLDYYTKTVFEFVCSGLGSQGTICGGGRYDGLIETLGGAATPSVGFAMGLERLLLVMEQQECVFPQQEQCVIYLGSMGEAASCRCARIAAAFRKKGMYAEYDLMGRSVKAQMKYANKIGARFSCIIGDSELESNQTQVKNMETGETASVGLDDLLSEIASQLEE